MVEILQMVGLLAVVFALSWVAGWWFVGRKHRPLTLVPIAENCRVRMVGPGGTYRCYFIRRDKSGLVFSAPLQRDRYVPVKVGESLMVQAPLADGLITFRSQVLSRDAETHEFTLAMPERIREVDRRSEPRHPQTAGNIVRINDEPASLVDLSGGGARIVTNAPIQPGDNIYLDLPAELGTVHGWALECLPADGGSRVAREIRVRFEEPLTGLTGMRRRHLYLGR
ncbi:MAG: PilZ domain-containing protein [Armatimonadetes bacterium]|nr:PilZ domain-containing protein [Armatimonadota bacterium]MBS1712008.1 PilZ domain-containing protein [Armatimonadota bacterium]MBX3109438.1 PilZ domain-containing protein [Fimbriimonadaceae bacterium]